MSNKNQKTDCKPTRRSVNFCKALKIIWAEAHGKTPRINESSSGSRNKRDYSSSICCTFIVSLIPAILAFALLLFSNVTINKPGFDSLSAIITFLVSSSLIALPLLIDFVKKHEPMEESNEIIASYSLHVLFEFIFFGICCLLNFFIESDIVVCLQSILLTITLFFALITNIKMIIQFALYSISHLK